MPNNKHVLHIGFTGTRKGMSDQQELAFRYYIKQHDLNYANCNKYFHHGDCVGADEQAATIVREITDWTIIGHPPLIEKYRAFFKSDTEWTPWDYHTRDRGIVNCSDKLIATPLDDKRTGGTWYTIGYSIEKRIGETLVIDRGGAARWV